MAAVEERRRAKAERKRARREEEEARALREANENNHAAPNDVPSKRARARERSAVEEGLSRRIADHDLALKAAAAQRQKDRERIRELEEMLRMATAHIEAIEQSNKKLRADVAAEAKTKRGARWTNEETQVLMGALRRYGTQFSAVAADEEVISRFPPERRTTAAIANRYHARRRIGDKAMVQAATEGVLAQGARLHEEGKAVPAHFVQHIREHAPERVGEAEEWTT